MTEFSIFTNRFFYLRMSFRCDMWKNVGEIFMKRILPKKKLLPHEEFYTLSDNMPLLGLWEVLCFIFY